MGVIGTTTISRERFDAFLQEALPLVERNWREIAQFDDIPLAIDHAKFRAMEEADMLRIYVARLDGLIIGYAAFVIGTSLHYSIKQAQCDVIYVDPDTRTVGIGLRLLRHCEQALRAEGVVLVWHHQKVAHPALGRVLEHMDYTHAENYWNKRLDRSV